MMCNKCGGEYHRDHEKAHGYRFMVKVFVCTQCGNRKGVCTTEDLEAWNNTPSLVTRRNKGEEFECLKDAFHKGEQMQSSEDFYGEKSCCDASCNKKCGDC